jgi:hypothetical protein
MKEFWFLLPGFVIWIGGTTLAAVVAKLGWIGDTVFVVASIGAFFLGVEINQRDRKED